MSVRVLKPLYEALCLLWYRLWSNALAYPLSCILASSDTTSPTLCPLCIENSELWLELGVSTGLVWRRGTEYVGCCCWRGWGWECARACAAGRMAAEEEVFCEKS